MSKIRFILQWVLAGFFCLFALDFLCDGSAASAFVLLLAGVLCMPLSRLRSFLYSKNIKKWMILTAVAVLFVTGFSLSSNTAPAQDSSLMADTQAAQEAETSDKASPDTPQAEKQTSEAEEGADAEEESVSEPETESAPHTHVWTQSHVQNATCTEAGVTTYTCSCAEKKTEQSAALGHAMSEWETVLAPTLSAEGRQERTCSRCGYTQSQALEKLSPAPSETPASQNATTPETESPSSTTETAKVWIPTKGGTKYHSSASCSGMEDPKRVTKNEALSQGFTACGKCW